ncbi:MULTISPECIES: hypothetical protein [Bacteria]|uniref:hypothetical protein n=1 Tax=Bacteria TaxID=2 RepID=UPI003C7DE4AF
MSDYTPTTEDVRRSALEYWPPITGEEFDRWLAAHDAEVRAALEAAEKRAEYWESEYRTAEDTKAELRAALAEQGTEEWEYGAQHSQGTNPHPSRKRAEEMVAWHASKDARKRPEARGKAGLVRRRPAGPWVPVDQPAANQEAKGGTR